MDISKILKEHKKSTTPERVELFWKMNEFHIFSARDIESAFSHIPRATIFRNIKLFSEIGALRRVTLDTGSEQYEVNDHANHHEHMMCKICGKINSFESDFICKLLQKVAKNANFHMTEHSVNIIGTCQKCNS